MNKNNMVKRRIVAYIVDVLIVGIIASIILVGHDTRVDESRSRDLMKLIDGYSNEEISTEEYIDKYEDIIYETNQDNYNENLLYLIVSVGYFLIFQFLNGGASIGKKLVKIRIVNKDKSEVRFWQLLIRVSLINEVLPMLLFIVFIKVLSSHSFFISYGIVSMLKSLIVVICGLTLIIDKKHIALHDKLSNSMVIEDE